MRFQFDIVKNRARDNLETIYQAKRFAATAGLASLRP
jgi:hypothetical protein